MSARTRKMSRWSDPAESDLAATDPAEAERRAAAGFRPTEVQRLRVGDEVLYVETLFGFDAGLGTLGARVLSLGMDEDGYTFRVETSGATIEADESTEVWARETR